MGCGCVCFVDCWLLLAGRFGCYSVWAWLAVVFVGMIVALCLLTGDGYCLYLLISCGFGICLLCVVVFFVCGLFLTAFGDLFCDVVCLGSLCWLGGVCVGWCFV